MESLLGSDSIEQKNPMKMFGVFKKPNPSPTPCFTGNKYVKLFENFPPGTFLTFFSQPSVAMKLQVLPCNCSSLPIGPSAQRSSHSSKCATGDVPGPSLWDPAAAQSGFGDLICAARSTQEFGVFIYGQRGSSQG